MMGVEPKTVRAPDLLWPGVIAFLTVTGVNLFLLPEEVGWYTFAFTPLIAGFAQGLVTLRLSPKGDVPLSRMVIGLVISHVLIVLMMVAFAFEGVICIVMAAPITVVVCMLGVAASSLVDAAFRRSKRILASPLFLLPLATMAMDKIEADPMRDQVRSEIIINASPEQIWPLIHNLDLPPATEPLVRLGIAHPTSLRTNGTDRFCNLSTGPMPEKIRVSEYGRRIVFEVLSTPPTMKELSPYNLNPAHLQGYFECIEGEITLHPQPNGSTLVRGRSTYRCAFAPQAYWRLWSRKIVSDTQLRVMREIKRQAEAKN